ncbi:hypothetical protein WICMUC_003149 [Wickerhamomyces mucosus]|uniref:Cyclin N-terminal domain-containing protein n=1 Tax=Wickerhamomyces mucosus TaxID=1378264 RepID=A0A9P8PLZ7_9ASCO|nr:hypothetical protein WICMUC_003149 [Wickerhamomyces mucosus]
MERTSYRFRTNENADSLKYKLSKTNIQTSNSTDERIALGEVSTNISRNVNTGIGKPAQRIQVFVEQDENKPPEDNVNPENTDKLLETKIPSSVQSLENGTEKTRRGSSERKPLAEIKQNNIQFEDYREGELAVDADLTENPGNDTGFEEEDEDEDDEDAMPDPMMPIINSDISRELATVNKMFYSEQLDEQDEDTYDISMVADYSPEIFNYLHSLEMRMRPNPNYMKSQSDLKWNMRGILVDWLVQVHSRFNLLPETLFLTINYIDRFLSKRKVSLSRFQLVGAVALFIAAKVEEINCPSVQEIAYMVDHAYTIEDILRAERFMIDVLEFEMGWPGPMSFLRRTSKADDYDFETRTLAKYFLELTIMDYRFIGSPPSWLAAGAHFLSRIVLGRGNWSSRHAYYSGYTTEQLKPLAYAIVEACRNPEEHHKSIFEKYQERRFRRSSSYVQEWLHSNEQ